MAPVMSPALAHDALFWFPGILTLLLLISLAGIVRSPAWAPSPAVRDDADQDAQPEPAGEPTTGPLPRRVAGQSGRVVTRAPGDLAHPQGVVLSPRVSGGPPWGPAPKPPGIP
jgi:hypothetical protein